MSLLATLKESVPVDLSLRGCTCMEAVLVLMKDSGSAQPPPETTMVLYRGTSLIRNSPPP